MASLRIGQFAEDEYKLSISIGMSISGVVGHSQSVANGVKRFQRERWEQIQILMRAQISIHSKHSRTEQKADELGEIFFPLTI